MAMVDSRCTQYVRTSVIIIIISSIMIIVIIKVMFNGIRC